jgi:hypothetical protein
MGDILVKLQISRAQSPTVPSQMREISQSLERSADLADVIFLQKKILATEIRVVITVQIRQSPNRM